MSEQIRNTGGSDGAGLCVGTSVQMCARFQNVPELEGFQDWLKRRPGGSYPEKLARDLKLFCSQKGVPTPIFLQHTGGDEDLLDLAMKTGRAVGITYGGIDDMYRGGIDHMVMLSHLDERDGAITDNNRLGWLWMPRKDLLSRWRMRSGGWLVVLLHGPPPPPTKYAVLFGQWGSGNCGNGRYPRNPFWIAPTLPAPTQPVAPPVTHEDGWKELRIDGRVVHQLFQDGKFLGVWDTDGWHPAVTHNSWLSRPTGEPPISPPGTAVGDTQNYGVDTGKIHSGRKYYLNGIEVSKGEALAAIGEPNLTDDSNKYHLTVVGDESLRRQVVSDFNTLPALRPFAAKVHLQCYTPNHWTVASRALRPGVTLQEPRLRGGKVVWYGEKYTAAGLEEGLKYTDPNYKPTPPPAPQPQPTPNPTPNPNPQPTPNPAPLPTNPTNGLLWLVILGLVGYIVWNRKRSD